MKKEEKDRTEHLYRDDLPEEIVKKLTPEVRRQYFLWDEIMKREIELYPRLVLPMVKAIFQREYPGDENVVLLSTEYTVSRIHEKGEKLLHAIRSDLLLRIARDLYHFECQIEKDGKMVFRMLEYDIHIALTHGKEAREKNGSEQGAAVFFPKSAALYLGDEKNVLQYEACTMYFQDGTKHVYRIPVMRVQNYSLEEIEAGHLDILIPFLPIRFRKQIDNLLEREKKTKTTDRKTREKIKRELSEFLSGCGDILAREKACGILSENAWKDIREFLWKACDHLLEKDSGLYEEVSAEVEPAIKLSREIIQELQEDIQELQGNNQELRQELEKACRELISEAVKEGKSMEETVNMTMRIFSLTRDDAKARVKEYQDISAP